MKFLTQRSGEAEKQRFFGVWGKAPATNPTLSASLPLCYSALKPTRRDIVKAGAGLAAILASGRAPAAVVRSMLAARASICGGKRLPYDAEVEYLESTGTQWIDTGVIPTTDLNFRLHCYYNTPMQAITGECVFGMRYTQGTQWRCMVSNYRVNTGGYASFFNNQRFISTISGVHEYEFSLINGVYSNGHGTTGTVNKAQTSPILPIPSSWTMHLFRGNYTTEPFNDVFKGKVFSLDLWLDSGLYVRKYRPVRFTNEQGVTEGAMYDRVTKQLFRNAGTGAFTYGPDKPLTANS